ncbi:MAG: hypothetical protein ACI8Y7_000580 [Candidatus Woesearchaeota archaeon]|jgi:hypothetical protein
MIMNVNNLLNRIEDYQARGYGFDFIPGYAIHKPHGAIIGIHVRQGSK